MKLLLIIIALSFSLSVIAQDPSYRDTTLSLRDQYLQKARSKKTAAWILLGGGTALALGGIVTNISSGWGEENKNKGVTVSLIGFGGMLASIPMFISAGVNKRKARNLN